MANFLKAALGGIIGFIWGIVTLFVLAWLAFGIDVWGLGRASHVYMFSHAFDDWIYVPAWLLSSIFSLVLPLVIGIFMFRKAHEESKSSSNKLGVVFITVIIVGTLLGGYAGYWEGVESNFLADIHSFRRTLQIALSILGESLTLFYVLTGTWLGTILFKNNFAV
jgi:uncharacterized membrane protein